MRALRLLLPVFYVLSSLPVQASYHYCLGRVKQISFYEVNDPSCVCPAEEDYGDCCDTEHAVLDFQDDHAPAPKIAFQPASIAILAPVFSYEMPRLLLQTEASANWRGPPPSGKQESIYLKNCNFRL